MNLVIDTERALWRRLPLATAAVALAAFLGGCGDDVVRADPEQSRGLDTIQEQPVATTATKADDGAQRHLADLPFDISWDLQLTAPVHRSWLGEKVPGLLCIQTTDGVIHGLEAYTGRTRWSTMPLPRLIGLPPYLERVRKPEGNGRMVNDDRLYVISGEELFVFDCQYGQLIFRHDIGQNGTHGFEPASGPFAHGGEGDLRVFVGDWEGRTRVITYDVKKQISYVIWQWNLNAVPTAQPNGRDKLIYVGDRAGILSCFGMDRERKWTYNARAPIMSPVLIREHTIYFGGEDNIFHALDRLTGKEMGNLFLEAPVGRQPFAFNLENDRIYAWTGGTACKAGLHAFHSRYDTVSFQDIEKHRLDVERMQEDWFVAGVDRLVASSPQHLYVTRPGSNTILNIDRKTGKIMWNWNLDEERQGNDAIRHIVEYADPTDEIRTIITASASGKLVAYRLFGHQR